MTSPTSELQKAIYERLTSTPKLVSLVGDRVFDRVPEKAVFPYVSFGTMEERNDDADCIEAMEVYFQLDAWSRAVGFLEARNIADAVRSALKVDLSLPDNALVLMTHTITRVFRDPDGLTSHAAISFNAVIETP